MESSFSSSVSQYSPGVADTSIDSDFAAASMKIDEVEFTVPGCQPHKSTEADLAAANTKIDDLEFTIVGYTADVVAYKREMMKLKCEVKALKIVNLQKLNCLERIRKRNKQMKAPTMNRINVIQDPIQLFAPGFYDPKV